MGSFEEIFSTNEAATSVRRHPSWNIFLWIFLFGVMEKLMSVNEASMDLVGYPSLFYMYLKYDTSV